MTYFTCSAFDAWLAETLEFLCSGCVVANPELLKIATKDKDYEPSQDNIFGPSTRTTFACVIYLISGLS